MAAGTLLVLVAESMPLLILGRSAQAIGGSALVTTAINLAGTPRRMGVVTATPVFLIASAVVCALSTSYFSLLYLVPRFLKDSEGWGALLVI
ncbi:hypothetical protein [Streptomyces sp. NRRL S-1813]|uniref:hypothetical protein n=1 Tax=Streptomyces sp. NRRL S-1813 TaxID=1463888 RepID=UPI001F1EDE89|nr:hypothetical protein [Streptomyces sp. NRRL S-1813]